MSLPFNQSGIFHLIEVTKSENLKELLASVNIDPAILSAGESEFAEGYNPNKPQISKVFKFSQFQWNAESPQSSITPKFLSLFVQKHEETSPKLNPQSSPFTADTPKTPQKDIPPKELETSQNVSATVVNDPKTPKQDVSPTEPQIPKKVSAIVGNDPNTPKELETPKPTSATPKPAPVTPATPQKAPEPSAQLEVSAVKVSGGEETKESETPVKVTATPNVPKPVKAQQKPITIANVITFLTRCAESVSTKSESVLREIREQSKLTCTPKIGSDYEMPNKIAAYFRSCKDDVVKLQAKSLQLTPTEYANSQSELVSDDLINLWKREIYVILEFYRENMEKKQLVNEIDRTKFNSPKFIVTLRKHARNLKLLGTSHIVIAFQDRMIERALEKLEQNMLTTFVHACKETLKTGIFLERYNRYRDILVDLLPGRNFATPEDVTSAITTLFKSAVGSDLHSDADKFNIGYYATTIKKPTIYDLCALLDYEDVLELNEIYEKDSKNIRKLLLETSVETNEVVTQLKEFADKHAGSAMGMFAREKYFKIAF